MGAVAEKCETEQELQAWYSHQMASVRDDFPRALQPFVFGVLESTLTANHWRIKGLSAQPPQSAAVQNTMVQSPAQVMPQRSVDASDSRPQNLRGADSTYKSVELVSPTLQPEPSGSKLNSAVGGVLLLVLAFSGYNAYTSRKQAQDNELFVESNTYCLQEM